MAGESDFVEVSNRGMDSTKMVLVTDAVKFVPLAGGEEIIIDNASKEGFERSDGWASDQLAKGAPGRGKMYGDDILHYPPAKSGNRLDDYEVDPDLEVWARYRPIQDGQYRPGWYSVYVWTPGGHTHSDWVRYEIHGSNFSPIASIEAPPIYNTGEIATINASATYHPAGKGLTYAWTHNGGDLGLRLERADTSSPQFVVRSLKSPRPGWAGLIEALLQHPEFLLPSDEAGAPPKITLTRVTLDLVGRIPTQDEFRRFEQVHRLSPMIDALLNSDDFKNFFFHQARGVLRSRGTEESDEPARLWTYIATTDLSYRELFTANFTVTPDWKKAPVDPSTGRREFSR